MTSYVCDTQRSADTSASVLRRASAAPTTVATSVAAKSDGTKRSRRREHDADGRHRVVAPARGARRVLRFRRWHGHRRPHRARRARLPVLTVAVASQTPEPSRLSRDGIVRRRPSAGERGVVTDMDRFRRQEVAAPARSRRRPTGTGLRVVATRVRARAPGPRGSAPRRPSRRRPHRRRRRARPARSARPLARQRDHEHAGRWTGDAARRCDARTDPLLHTDPLRDRGHEAVDRAADALRATA